MTKNGGEFNLSDLEERYPTEEAALEQFKQWRWADGVRCPYCDGARISTSKQTMPYRCKDCRKRFSLRTGTIMENSNLPYLTWLAAAYVLTTNSEGVPTTQLGSDLSITQKSAWHLAQRVLEATGDVDDYRQACHVGEESAALFDTDMPAGGLPKRKRSSRKAQQGGPRAVKRTRLQLEVFGKALVQSHPTRDGICRGDSYRFYCQSSEKMEQVDDGSIALTITSPPYWDAIDYDLHAAGGDGVWHRQREYEQFGKSYEQWLERVQKVFKEVYRGTMEGGFCAVVIGTILKDKKHYPAPYHLTEQLLSVGWDFHQDIIWNKVTGGVKRAGVFIQHPQAGYYYPNIMTEYILIFRKGQVARRDTEPALPIDDVFKRDIANNIWHIAPVPPRHIDHPCPFPEEIARRLVLLYSQKGDEVLDPFLGSGQTAKVALHHERRAVGYDIEQEYIDLSVERLNDNRQRIYHLLPKVEKVAV